MRCQASLLAVVLAGFGAAAFAQNPTPSPAAPPQVAPADATVRQSPEKTSAVNPSPAPQISEVAKLSEAGVGEKAILSYIANSPGFALTAEDVIALNQRGVPLTIITAMLQQPARIQFGDMPIIPPPPTMATVTLNTGPNPPIIYPTPAREAVPLTSPDAVYFSPYGYGVSSVIITG